MQLLRMSLVIFPHQTVLKALQMNASTPVKEYCNPWAAFAVVGILQGGVYGQANTHFARVLGINSSSATTTATSSSAINNNTNTTVTAVKRMFRGSAFAGGRDMISQGLPFMCSGLVRSVVLDPLFPTIDSNMTHANQDQFGGSDNNNDKMIASIKHWTALLTTSIVATYLSQGLHNLQITMQADPTLSYARVVPTVFQQHGFSMLYKGAEARVGLLLIVNVLNELLLKPAWTSIPV